MTGTDLPRSFRCPPPARRSPSRRPYRVVSIGGVASLASALSIWDLCYEDIAERMIVDAEANADARVEEPDEPLGD
ncbi:hypothetical protein MBEHAL_1857 [Halarchaeum acidiphilum MH1-52-1]|uniref:Uncharacterized protein n=1 Tax=Halarchaeum acidiphilum MH1-52-1 TaxID=1261545 RepID=U2YWB8_9EURY|nr:hypothetical protein [Halarchaeum acidiphilum]GAD53097.1 hypothetical protein MBEHAL_1857 [Halarchaeum acidiphilum MH1-52-1]